MFILRIVDYRYDSAGEASKLSEENHELGVSYSILREGDEFSRYCTLLGVKPDDTKCIICADNGRQFALDNAPKILKDSDAVTYYIVTESGGTFDRI